MENSIFSNRQHSSKISQMSEVWIFRQGWEVFCSSVSQASFYLGYLSFLHNSENRATWDSDLFIHLHSVILVNNATGQLNTNDSQTAVCIIMAIHTTALQSK